MMINFYIDKDEIGVIVDGVKHKAEDKFYAVVVNMLQDQVDTKHREADEKLSYDVRRLTRQQEELYNLFNNAIGILED